MQVLPGTMCRVALDNKHQVLATNCGKMRKRRVRLSVQTRAPQAAARSPAERNYFGRLPVFSSLRSRRLRQTPPP
jgi:hypothetical protein